MITDNVLEFPQFSYNSKKLTVFTRTWIKERGYIPCDAERKLPGTFHKKDQYGFIDMVAIKAGRNGVLGIQITSRGNLSTRIKKAKSKDAYWVWLAAGNPVEFHGWEKRKDGMTVARIVRVTRSELY